MKHLILFLALLAAPAFAAEREDQWLYRELEGAGMERFPTAVFLDWMYTDVVFRVQCDRTAGELVFDYFGDGVVKLTADEQMELILGEVFIPMRTALDDQRLVGRLPAQAVVNGWNAESEVGILAPNEMGEPWHTGAAGPLKTVAEDCAAITP